MNSSTSSTTANRTLAKRSTPAMSNRDKIDDGFDGYTRNFQIYRGMSPNTSNRLETRVKDLEESVDEERDGRLRAERELDELGFQVDNLKERLEEADCFNSTQSEMNRRREQELLKLKTDFETLASEREMTEASLRKRHQDALNEVNQQLDASNRQRTKLEKERQQAIGELEAMSTFVDSAIKAKGLAEGKAAELEELVRRLKAQADEQSHQLQDANALKARLSHENFELQRQLRELDISNVSLAKMKTSLQIELDDLKQRLDEETRMRNQLAIQVTNLQLDLDNANLHIEEEMEAAENARGQVQRAQTDLQQNKVKHDKDMASLVEQFDDARRKMAARIAEIEGDAEQQRVRSSKMEKERNKLQIQINETSVELESARSQAGELSKRLKQADNVITEYQSRVDDLTNAIQSSSSEMQRLQVDIVRLRAAHEDVTGKLDSANRENKQLTESGREALSQLKELRNHIQDLHAVRIQLETDRDGLKAEVDDLRDALREAQSRLEASGVAVSQIKVDFERRIKDKEEEMEALRKNSQRAIEELQRTVVDVENKYKSELNRIKKKYEQQAQEYDHQLDTMNRSNAELGRANKALAARIKELELSVDDERQKVDEARQAAVILERKRIVLNAELDDIRSLLEAADRVRKNSEMELAETQQRVADLSLTLNAAATERRHLEAELTSVRGELDDTARERSEVADRAARLQVEVSRVLDELRQSEDGQRSSEAFRLRMEAEMKDMAARLEVAETVGLREGKRLVAKLQSKLLEFEAELDNTARRERELANENRKLQRLLAEQKTNSEEQQRLAAQSVEQNHALHQRVKTLKRQLEEAEEVVLLTLNKYRKATQSLQDAEQSRTISSTENCGRLFVAGGSPSGTMGIKNNRSMSVTREVTRVVRV